jgi:hypothetical protein
LLINPFCRSVGIGGISGSLAVGGGGGAVDNNNNGEKKSEKKMTVNYNVCLGHPICHMFLFTYVGVLQLGYIPTGELSM